MWEKLIAIESTQKKENKSKLPLQKTKQELIEERRSQLAPNPAWHFLVQADAKSKRSKW